MTRLQLIGACLMFFATVVRAEPPSAIDTEEFKRQTEVALKLRAERTLSSNAFLAMMKRDDVVLLDTRSASAYAQKHLAGAVHLNFSDFTAEKLAKVIPSKATTVLIYCNNNILGDQLAFPTKVAPMALNIPTFINLYGYGYEDVYELGALVNINDPRFEFEGTSLK